MKHGRHTLHSAGEDACAPMSRAPMPRVRYTYRQAPKTLGARAARPHLIEKCGHHARVPSKKMNHQFLGANNAFHAFENRENLQGRLGVFWHTQGSGKSYSMVMLARKIKRKYAGNFTFFNSCRPHLITYN